MIFELQADVLFNTLLLPLCFNRARSSSLMTLPTLITYQFLLRQGTVVVPGTLQPDKMRVLAPYASQ